MNRDVERALESCDPPIREVARRACDSVLAVFADAVVTVDEKNSRFGTTIGFGTTAGYKGLRFTVTPQRAYVTLGIAHGTELPDPSRLMEGTGKVHRHVKLRQPEDLDRLELRQLMAAAMARGTLTPTSSEVQLEDPPPKPPALGETRTRGE
jgi:hypothetical protein